MGVETRHQTLHTADDLALDGDLLLPDTPVAAAVVCHPHPLYGGDRFNAVVQALVRALADAGVAALRFDFRGVNRSQGRHGGGRDEVHDVVAALDALDALDGVPGPRWLIGYSFGAAVALGVDDPRVAGWVGVAPPLGMIDASPAAGRDDRPTLLLAPRHDQFTRVELVEQRATDWTETSADVIESADHFLAGHLDDVGERVSRWVVARARPAGA